MDTPIMPRRSIPTELKPRLRLYFNITGQSVWIIHVDDWMKLKRDQRKIVVNTFNMNKGFGPYLFFFTRYDRVIF